MRTIRAIAICTIFFALAGCTGRRDLGPNPAKFQIVFQDNQGNIINIDQPIKDCETISGLVRWENTLSPSTPPYKDVVGFCIISNDALTMTGSDKDKGEFYFKINKSSTTRLRFSFSSQTISADWHEDYDLTFK